MKKLKDLNWNHLYCFYEVAKAQSLKDGAKAAGVASSTISEQIKKLEKTFAKDLFYRTQKGLSLTIEGQKLFEKTKVIFESGSKLLELFSEDTVGGYPVNVGFEETISYDLASEFCSQYWDLYTPYGTVNTTRHSDHNVLIENLALGNIDWAISFKPPKRKNLSYLEIGSFDIAFCCAKELFKKFNNPKDLLINIPFAENRLDQSLNSQIDHYLRGYEVLPKEKIFSDHFDYIKKLCKRGRCVMTIPINPLVDYEEFHVFDLGKPMRVSLFAIWLKSNEEMISIRKLQELVQSKLSELPSTYKDLNYQVEVSEVDESLLKK